MLGSLFLFPLCTHSFHKVHIRTEEMAEFGEELLALLDDVQIKQRRLLREDVAIFRRSGGQAVEVLLTQSGQVLFRLFYLRQQGTDFRLGLLFVYRLRHSYCGILIIFGQSSGM